MIVERSIAKGQIVALTFGQANVPASQSAVALVGSDPSGNTGYLIPWDFHIVAVAYNLSAAQSAGTMTLTPTVDGTADSDGSIVADGTDQEGSRVLSRTAVAGAAGSVVGMDITTDAGFLPITTDLTVVVYILVAIEGI